MKGERGKQNEFSPLWGRIFKEYLEEEMNIFKTTIAVNKAKVLLSTLYERKRENDKWEILQFKNGIYDGDVDEKALVPEKHGNKFIIFKIRFRYYAEYINSIHK